MPNWVNNRFVVYGDKGQLLKFYMDMRQATSEQPQFTPVENSWDEAWVGNLFLGAGYTKADIESGDINCRGKVEEIIYDSDRVTIYDYTAWSPNNESMEKMLGEKYPGLEMVYQAEEPGMSIFVNSDATGKYISARFLIDAWTDAVDANGNLLFEGIYEDFDNISSALEAVAQIAGVPVQDVENFLDDSAVDDVDWSEWLRGILKVPEDVDCALYVHEYTLD